MKQKYTLYYLVARSQSRAIKKNQQAVISQGAKTKKAILLLFYVKTDCRMDVCLKNISYTTSSQGLSQAVQKKKQKIKNIFVLGTKAYCAVIVFLSIGGILYIFYKKLFLITRDKGGRR